MFQSNAVSVLNDKFAAIIKSIKYKLKIFK